jgi:hypothetical protein
MIPQQMILKVRGALNNTAGPQYKSAFRLKFFFWPLCPDWL